MSDFPYGDNVGDVPQTTDPVYQIGNPIPNDEFLDIELTPDQLLIQFLEHLDFDEVLQAKDMVEKHLGQRIAKERADIAFRAKTLSGYLGVEPTALFVVEKPKKDNVVKFRHPSDPKKTWSGKGARPKWMKELIEAGTEIESLAA